ncbi:MAG: isoprenylcysteine carboxylmethyltransferase family protein [bacterium]
MFTALFLVYFTIVVVVKVHVFRMQGDKCGTLKDNWTFPIIYASYFLAVWGSLAEFFFLNPSIISWVSLMGYLLGTAGVVITRRCVLALGRWWSIRIEMKEDHQVITEGPYRFSRHPYYLGALLELVGLCLILNSFRTLLYVVLVHLPILIARISSEERVLIAFLGSRYLDYKKKVGIVPFSLGGVI